MAGEPHALESPAALAAAIAFIRKQEQLSGDDFASEEYGRLCVALDGLQQPREGVMAPSGRIVEEYPYVVVLNGAEVRCKSAADVRALVEAGR